MSGEPSEIETLAKSLHAQTQRADAMAVKFHERGQRITALQQEAVTRRQTIATQEDTIRRLRRGLDEIGKIAANHVAAAVVVGVDQEKQK